MQRSNSYIIMFIVALTLVCATLLSLTHEVLKDRQAANVAYEKKQFILKTFMGSEKVAGMEKTEVNKLYDEMVNPMVVNYKGEVQEGLVADEVEIEKEYKKDPKERVYPLYTIKEGESINYFVLPTYGMGLWDNIWGYVAIKSDRNTIKGVVFDHKGETPGLGARITTDEIQNRYVGKEIKNEEGKLVSVTMTKGENGGGEKSLEHYADNPHKVDGMSGATLTADGVNAMLDNYLDAYNNYFKKIGDGTKTASAQ